MDHSQKIFKKIKETNTKATEMYRQVRKQYRTNTENIYQESQEKELIRLTKLPDSLKKFLRY